MLSTGSSAASESSSSGPRPPASGLRLADVAVTLLLWVYFTLGYLFFFFPRHLWARFLAREREAAFQRVSCSFYRWFFALARRLVPGLRIEAAPEVRSLRSCVLVCNHVSYLDPLLIISLFPRHRTVVKGAFFRFPFMGGALRTSGFLPSSSGPADRGPLSHQLMRALDSLPAFIEAGGVFFVFPEGHRSRDGTLGPFERGAFSIARRVRAPLAVCRISNTERLFPPGRWRFDAAPGGPIRLELLAVLHPDWDAPGFRLSDLMEQVRRLMLSEK